MHALFVNLLEQLVQSLRVAVHKRRRDDVRRLIRRIRLLIRIDRLHRLNSPRVYLRKLHFHPVSFWSNARELDDGVADQAYMHWTGFPRHAFNALADEVAHHLPPAYVPHMRHGHSGQPSVLDYKDLTAIGLRSFRVIGGQQFLATDFAIPQPSISRALSVICPVLRHVALTWEAAEVRMLTGEEGRNVENIDCSTWHE